MRDGPGKTLLLLRAKDHVPSARFDAEVTRRVREVLGARHALEAVELHTTERRAPRLSIVPFRRDAVALAGVRGAADAVDAVARALGTLGTLERHTVEQSTPRERVRTWPLGEHAPGTCLVTCFRRRRGLDHTAFLREWYERHTPLALETHPLAGYVRNRVIATHGAATPAWDGVVLESFATDEDLLSPRRFFGGTGRALRGMWRVATHVPTFLELGSLENHLVRERVLLDDAARP